MNDFLQSLRNGTMKRQDRNRKQYDKPQYRNGERGGNRDKRNPNARKSFGGPDYGEIKKLLQTISDNTELTRIAQERAAEALERIARSLSTMARDQDPVAAAPATGHSAAAPSPVNTDSAPAAATRQAEDLRLSTIAIIKRLHDDGESFETIAVHLNDQGIPTFSGKGSWRAQNVGRAFNAAHNEA